MAEIFRELVLPRALDDIDAQFMTKVLRESGVITETNEVMSQEEAGVGMTAGYFSAIKKIRCAYREPTDAQDSFVAKAWPSFELLPKESIRAMFVKDIKAYEFPDDRFYPRPNALLARFDVADERWALVMEDADTFAEHKVHEREMTLDEVMRMVPKLVEVAVAWEGCDEGDKARELVDLGVNLWASDENLAVFKSVMPGAAKLVDRVTTLEGSGLVTGPAWDSYLGGSGICETFTRKLDAFFESVHPANGATCTLSHGDLRGDNIFFCEPSARYPDGWLCIDFQLMFRGPVPSDLAYLMSSATVLPEVYSGEHLHRVLKSFYEQFMGQTAVYKDYTYEMFVREFATMTAVMFVYTVGVGAAVWQASAFNNAQAARVELGDQGTTEADLTPEELRQRMWWRKLLANCRENFKTFDQYDEIKYLPEKLEGLGAWIDLPPHLR